MSLLQFFYTQLKLRPQLDLDPTNSRTKNSWDNKMLVNLCKTLIIAIPITYFFAIFISNKHTCRPSGDVFSFSEHISVLPPKPLYDSNSPTSTTNVSHLVFGISASANAWKARKSYIQSWWLPNVTRGYVFLDKIPSDDPLPWPSTSPPFRISEETSYFEVYSRHILPSVIRVVRVIIETFRERDRGVRWFVMGDDDTIFVVENLVKVLAKYDHTKFYYVGGTSECTKSNFDFSYDMAFGGAGFAVSYPLAEALVKNLDKCISRYPYFHVSDRILHSCIGDLGVSVTPEQGFHQIDLVGDISGLLSAHPQAPLVSLHHFDIVDPIFPKMKRHETANHLMKAAKADHSRMLQQTICYQKSTNWTFSTSWGYSAQVYEQVLPRNVLRRPLETFRPWSDQATPPLYMFNTRLPSKDPCEAPHVFFFKSAELDTKGNKIVTTYERAGPRRLPPCSFTGNHSANHIFIIKVSSPSTKLDQSGRSECCDVKHVSRGRRATAEIILRDCLKDEVIA